MNVDGLIKTMFDDVFGKDLDKFQKGVDEFMDEVYKEVRVPSFVLSKGSYPKVNIVEKEKEYQITAAVPGMTREELEITYIDGQLSLVGKSLNEKIEKDERFICRELKKSSFIRTFQVDQAKINPRSIRSSLLNGELTITLEKINKNPSEEGVKIKID